MPPQVNARLTAVNDADAASGGRDDWDAPAAPDGPAAGVEKWAGDEPAYYTEKITRADGNVVATRILYVDTHVATAAGIDTDDVLTFTDPDGEVRRARAALVARRALAGVPLELQTTRLELELR